MEQLFQNVCLEYLDDVPLDIGSQIWFMEVTLNGRSVASEARGGVEPVAEEHARELLVPEPDQVEVETLIYKTTTTAASSSIPSTAAGCNFFREIRSPPSKTTESKELVRV
ncbi:hypothetical protein Trydic_g12184 [Trypoxylus dichotomus]